MAILAILIIIPLLIVLFFTIGWQGILGLVIVGIFCLVMWIKKGDAAKYFENVQSEEASKAHAKQTWVQASQRNRTVECKSCGKKVAELSAVCPDCGEPLPGLRIKCPKCSSSHINISKKGFDVGQAAAGGILVGTVGLAAGMIGSKDCEFVCLGCNHRWGLPSQ